MRMPRRGKYDFFSLFRMRAYGKFIFLCKFWRTILNYKKTYTETGMSIAGFHCHTIIKTIKQIKSRIKEIKKYEYSNRLTKVQVCAMYRAGDIRRNVLLKFIRLCMETPCLCPSLGHKYGGRKLTKTYVIEFCYKKPVVVFWELINIYVSTYSHTRTVQIAKSSGQVIFLTYVIAFATAILTSCHAKA